MAVLMTADHDHIRDAADRLERPSECSDPWVCCIHPTPKDSWPAHYPASDKDRATAALLRAVAAWHTSDSDGEVCINCHMIWPCTQARTALDLADTVLGRDNNVMTQTQLDEDG